MPPAEVPGVAGGAERELRTWLAELTEAAEVLLRHTERQLDQDVAAAFTAGQASTVRLRQLERDRVRTLRERLRRRRSAQAAEGGC
jgi:hypothetical protein